VHFPGFGIYQQWKCIDIGPQQLFQSPLFEDLLDNRMFEAQFLQLLFACTVLAGLGFFRFFDDPHLFKEYLPYLLRRIDVETLPCHIDNLRLDLLQFGVKFFRELSQRL
jgi:hypothetical protein